MSINKLINELKPIRDSKEQLRRHLVWMIMTRVILFTLLIAVTVVLQSLGRNVILPPNAVTMAFLSVVFIFSIGSAGLLQTRTSHLPRFGLFRFFQIRYFLLYWCWALGAVSLSSGRFLSFLSLSED
ncbi:hypothetical protein VT98_12932 [Candidatus Electrothrix communis]|uniref:Uncharacterized protein n=1 Tax=Candidatus Electrothrix communis TaxID=1859133 RepID=A0A3S3QZ64_9BACT|nr:hypothetical protein VT98_12932 [Candidatus Electrothrix communis]